jgi:hypothetical protein
MDEAVVVEVVEMDLLAVRAVTVVRPVPAVTAEMRLPALAAVLAVMALTRALRVSVGPVVWATAVRIR